MPLICPRQGWVVSEDSGGAPPRAQRPWKSGSDRLTGRDCCAMYPFKLGRGVFPAWADIYWSGHVSDVVGVAEDAGGNSSTAERNDGCFLSSEKITPGLIAWRCLCHSSSNNTEINNLMTDPVGPSSAPRPLLPRPTLKSKRRRRLNGSMPLFGGGAGYMKTNTFVVTALLAGGNTVLCMTQADFWLR